MRGHFHLEVITAFEADTLDSIGPTRDFDCNYRYGLLLFWRQENGPVRSHDLWVDGNPRLKVPWQALTATAIPLM